MAVVSPPPPDGAPRWTRPGAVVFAVVRPLLTVALLVAVYYLLPVDRHLSGRGLAVLIIELCLVAAVIVWQIRLILRAKYPVLQGIQALALTVPLYLLVFANVYYLISRDQPGSFAAPLTRTDALYFCVTTFSTVGYGDITAVSQTARALVTGQMMANLLVIGLALRVILTAVERGRRRKATEIRHPTEGP